MKAIRIDSNSGKVEQVETTGKLPDIYRLLGCKYIEAVRPSILVGADILYVDEEGLLHGENLFFKIDGFPQPIAGNGLILGTDEEGDNNDCETSVGIVSQCVEFLFKAEG
jgi:hypothetical protein